jgi:hypothetical protein
MDWLTVLAASLIAGAVATAVAQWLLDGRLRRAQECGLVCPRLHKSVVCRVVQDVRTGQWKALEACSVFKGPGGVRCDCECARLVNLGISGYRLARS